MTTPPQFDGHVEQLRAGATATFEDLQVGIYGVWEDSASIGLAGNGKNEILDLDVGEAGESQGVHVRLCAVWLDKPSGDRTAPSSDGSQVYYVIGRGDSAPECPAQITPDA